MLMHWGVNLPGIAMAVVGFGAAFVARDLLRGLSEGVMMIIAGPLIVALDLLYRSRQPERDWWSFRKGGSLLFLPAWQLGALWLVLGVYYCC